MSDQAAPRFNVRVYGIWLNLNGEVLLSLEEHQGRRLCKFPGGGLEFGEGLLDGLRREWREELCQEPEVIRHYYTTDFFQPSAFRPNEQVISVYYLVRCDQDPEEVLARCCEHEHVWVAIADLAPELLTLPIDQHVAERLRREFAEVIL